ncbi:hypothetical protein SAMN06264365_105224 [Actinoplanes regularis]|uniref:Uncharacterized protein n=1 Tax=Actinoplanes regularis TaxID=52697 RepID=A0A238YVS8_9ACTN|nr:hypothetical protein SAMN06264365_105224 [Actinoplanes regularis]
MAAGPAGGHHFRKNENYSRTGTSPGLRVPHAMASPR